MSHARNVKTSPGKAEGTKCVEVYPRTDSDSSSRTSLFLPLQETRYLLINKIFDRIFGSINSPVIYIYILDIFMQGIPVGKESCRKQVNRGKLITSGLFWFARNSVAPPVRLDPRSRRSRRDRDLRSVIMAVINHLVKLHRKLA